MSELENLLAKYRNAYYRGEPEISDDEYDELEDKLRKENPDSLFLKSVGARVFEQPTTHKIPMGSLDDKKTEAEVRDWLIPGEEYHISYKADGASVSLTYVAGRLESVVERGDGFVGGDVTQNVIKASNAILQLPTAVNCVVRCEAVLTKTGWDAVGGKNPRNSVVGLLGRKSGESAEHITLLAIDYIDDEERKTEAEKWEVLENLGFTCPKYLVSSDFEKIKEFYEQCLSVRRGDVWGDGIVLKVNSLEKFRELNPETALRPKGHLKWKFLADTAEAQVQGIEFSLGITGAVTPVVLLEPTFLDGSTVSRASISNFDRMRELGLRIGDTVIVKKSGDIIPFVERVLKASKNEVISVPEICPRCQSPLTPKKNLDGDGVIVQCSGEKCPTKVEGRIANWFNKLNVLGAGEALVQALVQAGVTCVSELYTYLETDAESLGKLDLGGRVLGPKSATSLLEEWRNKAFSMPIHQFLGSFVISGLGRRRAELIIKACPEFEELEPWLTGELETKSKAAGVPGLGPNISREIVAIKDEIEKVKKHVNFTKTVKKKPVCISGTLSSGRKKKDWGQELEGYGYTLQDSVTKDLEFLVCEEPTTSKAVKAQKLGIRVLSEKELIELLKK